MSGVPPTRPAPGRGRPGPPVALALLPLLFLLALGLSGPPASAQEEAGGERESAGVPAERRSARATIRTFLTAVADAARDGTASRLDDAAACLDLSSLPGIDESTRRQLAVDLKEVIDRTRFVEYGEVPSDPQGPPWVFLRDAHGEIVIARQGSGEWLFTRKTVESIPALVRATRDRERVEGVAESPSFLTPAAWVRGHVPRSMREVGFLLEHWQWIGLFLLILVGVVVDRVLVLFLLSGTRKATRRLIPQAPEEVLQRTARPLGLLAMAMLWRFGIVWLGLPPQALSVVVVAITFVVAASGVWAAYRFVDVLSEYMAERAKKTATKYDDLLVPLVRKSLKIFIIVFGLVFVADNLNVNITSLVAGLGLGGLAFALAAQDVVKNFFGSITVLMDRPFHVGDWIVVGDLEGTVEEVGFRSTRVRTFYNSLITLPNASLLSTAVDNLGARRYRRWKTTLSVTYDTPPEKMEAFCEGIRELVRKHPHTRKDYFHVYANEFGAASLNVLLYVFFVTPDWAAELQERHRLFLDILRLAHRLEVEFAFPTQTLHLLRPGELPDHGPQPPVSEAKERGRSVADEILAGTEPRSGRPAVGHDPRSGGEAG
jgi:MscS family membrane protein